MDIQAYLRRIKYEGSLEPTFETLRGLHRAHMLAVPFENLDIPLHHPIVLDEGLLFDKIVNRRRGGFCFELNGLFSALLRELGFDLQRLSARVSDGNGGFGIEFDHMTLLVQLEEPYLADVGFGDSFREPLRFDVREAQVQERGSYLLREEGEHITYLRLEGDEWKPQYIFGLQPYALSDFAQACDYHQTSPESSFTQRRVCSVATLDGRITLSNMKLIVTRNGRKEEHMVESEDEYRDILRESFGIVL